MNLSATYSLNGAAPVPATVAMLKDRLQINLLDEGGVPRSFYWYYEQVAQRKENPFSFTYLDYPPQVLNLASAEAATQLKERAQGSRSRIFTRRRATFFKVTGGIVFMLLFLFF